MQIVKMFDWFEEIQPYLNTLNTSYGLRDLEYNIENYTAVPFWVHKDIDHCTPFQNAVTDYLLNQGCKENEIVYFWINW